MGGQGGVQLGHTAGDPENGSAEVPGDHGVQEERHVHGAEGLEDRGAEATVGAGQQGLGGVAWQGDHSVQGPGVTILPVQKPFAGSVERSLKEILLSTWQSATKTSHSGILPEHI